MKPLHALCIGILGVGLVLDWDDVRAGADLGGRLWLTYQRAGEPKSQQEYFIQHYEAVLRDRLFEQNDIALTFYFDNSKDLTGDLTYRRYRGNLDVQHRYYTFNARYSPRQEVTPLELDTSREIRQNQLSLDIHVPNTPRLRLSYDTRTQYLNTVQSANIRDLRADIQYQYRVLDLRANRWSSTSKNGNDLQTDVTGASARATKTFAEWLTVDGGYEYRFTETDRKVGPRNTVSNHTVSGLFSGHYRRLMAATLAASTRRLLSEYIVDTRGRDDNVNFVLSFFEGRHVRPEASRTYMLTEQNGSQVTSDFATLQVLADGNVHRGTWGRAQVTRRFDLNTEGGVLPSHIYMVSTRSHLRQGMDLRAEMVANERLHDSPVIDRFQTSSLFDLFLAPRRNLTVTPHIQYSKDSDQLSFLHNDQATWGVAANYIPRFPRMSLGMDVNQTRFTTGFRRVDTAGAVNVSVSMRSRSTMSLSYGRRRTERFESGGGSVAGVSNAETLNAQAQVWFARRASLSINYTGVNRDPEKDSSQLALTYRQDF